MTKLPSATLALAIAFIVTAPAFASPTDALIALSLTVMTGIFGVFALPMVVSGSRFISTAVQNGSMPALDGSRRAATTTPPALGLAPVPACLAR